MLSDPKQEYEKMLRYSRRNFIDSTDLSLEEWLKLIYDPPRDKHFDSYTFPTEAHRNEYLATIDKRSLAEVKKLIYFFLPPDVPLGQDIRSLADNELTHILERLIAQYDDLPYFRKRWLIWALSKGERISPRESIYWVLDLIDACPEEAIRVINAYGLLYGVDLPDGSVSGLFDCIEIIRAKCLTSSAHNEIIDSLPSRDFEHLVESLYESMGYNTLLTPPSKDGGYDIIASKEDKGLKTIILIDAKHYREPVGVEIVRQMQGVVAKEGASKGVIVTTSKFTRGSLKLEKDDPRLELITRNEFIQLMNQYHGVDWTSEIDRLIYWSKRNYLEQQNSKVLL